MSVKKIGKISQTRRQDADPCRFCSVFQCHELVRIAEIVERCAGWAASNWRHTHEGFGARQARD